MNDFAPLEQIPMLAVVTAESATRQQIEQYRRMTGEQRLKIALELHKLSCDVAREGIRRQNPNADEPKIERLLRQRLTLANAEKQTTELAIAKKLA